MDVKSLYTNIPNADGLTALKYFLKEFNITKYSHDAILRLTELVLTRNCFIFNGKFYMQINGIMMGTPIGGDFANLFLGYLEYLIRLQYRGKHPELLKRYIDDNFGATTMTRPELEAYCDFVNNFHPTIKYEFTITEESVPMLDTKLYIKNRKIESTIHYKDTDGHTYLKYGSEHPKSLKKSIPYSQFLRQLRINSEESEFWLKSEEMCDFFRKRGYPDKIIREGLNKAAALSREEALEPKKPKKEAQDIITFPITYNTMNTKIVSAVLKRYATLKNDPIIGKAFETKPTIAYKRGYTIGRAVTNTRIEEEESEKILGTFTCGRHCTTCKHVNNAPSIVGSKGSVPVEDKFNCLSKNVVYAITCDVCGDLYIGETCQELRKRFLKHRRGAINLAERMQKERGNPTPSPTPKKKRKKRKKTPKKPPEKPTAVAEHFCQDDHTYHDMRVAGICYVDDTARRKEREQRIIMKLSAFTLNRDVKHMECATDNN